jgi:hypothetical protein
MGVASASRMPNYRYHRLLGYPLAIPLDVVRDSVDINPAWFAAGKGTISGVGAAARRPRVAANTPVAPHAPRGCTIGGLRRIGAGTPATTLDSLSPS